MTTERAVQFRLALHYLQSAQEIVGALAFTVPEAADKVKGQAEFDCLMRADQFLARATREIKSAETVGDTLSVLAQSIATVREKQKCAAIGGNVKLFPKSS